MKRILIIAVLMVLALGAGGVAIAATRGQDATGGIAQTQPQESDAAWLGVQLAGGDGGATVRWVVADSPAAEAGLQRGDVIRAIDDQAVDNAREVVNALSGKQPGGVVKIGITRDGNPQDINVTLEARPEPLVKPNPVLPEIQGIPRGELFGHILGGTFQFRDKDGNNHTVSVEFGTVASVDANAKTINVTLNAGGSETLTITDEVTARPRDLTQFANGDKVVIVSVDEDLRAVYKGAGKIKGLPFFGLEGERGPRRGLEKQRGGGPPVAPARLKVGSAIES